MVVQFKSHRFIMILERAVSGFPKVAVTLRNITYGNPDVRHPACRRESWKLS